MGYHYSGIELSPIVTVMKKKKNAIIFKACNKLQEVETYITVEFVNGKILTTTNSRKVSII